MLAAQDIARICCGAFFATGLVTGVWKYRRMATSPEAVAPVYVDICHRAALMYAFACILLAEFARLSVWNEAIDRAAVSATILFFALAVASYAVHGVLADTDNQLARPHRLGKGNVHPVAMSAFIYTLAVVEIAGFLTLFAGYLAGVAA